MVRYDFAAAFSSFGSSNKLQIFNVPLQEHARILCK